MIFVVTVILGASRGVENREGRRTEVTTIASELQSREEDEQTRDDERDLAVGT